jgi:NAD(P)-dependent dehydrogenase (short-subunit alcohol dehydrogenase family)
VSLRFDERVVIVTGAGRGLGAAYARLFGRLGARVVVNDLGGSAEGEGSDAFAAEHVAHEISEAGGSAIANASDVSTSSGAARLVGDAVKVFGRVDAVVNNAGIMRWADINELTGDDLAKHWAVHTVGTFNVVKAAWPHMVDAGFGRVVNTTSTGVFGLPKNLAYATAKGGVIGLTRSTAMAGRRHDIKVNAIAPAAATRLGGDTEDPNMSPDLVAPMAAYLAHEDCPVTGEIYTAGAGRFARLFLASTPGVLVDPASGAPTIDDVASRWAAINDESGYTVPADLIDWSTGFTSHLSG